MKKDIYTILLIIIFISTTASCKSINKTNIAEEVFAELYATCSMNESVIFNSAENKHKINDLINLDLKNISEQKIIFPVDFNVKLLSFDPDTNKWNEQPNDLKYLPTSTSIIMDSTDELSPHEVVTISPTNSDEKPLEIRVVVTGLFYKNDAPTDKCVGAFSDIYIIP